jgi:hypothetical protein
MRQAEEIGGNVAKTFIHILSFHQNPLFDAKVELIGQLRIGFTSGICVVVTSLQRRFEQILLTLSHHFGKV